MYRREIRLEVGDSFHLMRYLSFSQRWNSVRGLTGCDAM